MIGGSNRRSSRCAGSPLASAGHSACAEALAAVLWPLRRSAWLPTGPTGEQSGRQTEEEIERWHDIRAHSGSALSKSLYARPLRSLPPHLHWARPRHIRAGTGLTPSHICAGAARTRATSAPGLGSAVPHLRRDWGGVHTAAGSANCRRAADPHSGRCDVCAVRAGAISVLAQSDRSGCPLYTRACARERVHAQTGPSPAFHPP